MIKLHVKLCSICTAGFHNWKGYVKTVSNTIRLVSLQLCWKTDDSSSQHLLITSTSS